MASVAHRPRPSTLGERLRRLARPPRRLKFTRGGKYFTAMTLLIGFGAINTGNNLLYLLLGMMLTLIIVSGILSEAVLKKLTVQRQLPGRLFVDHPAIVEVKVFNGKRRVPSLSIQVVDRIEGVAKSDRPAAYFLRLDADRHASASYRFAFPHRGRWTLSGFEIATNFPFELFRKSREVDDVLDILVYPVPLEPAALPGRVHPRVGETRSPRAGQGGDFFALRDYRHGDDVRRVHWKVSAKRERMVIKEFEREEARVLTVAFANARPAPAKGRHGASDGELEHSVQVCAGLVQQLLERGYAVGLRTFDVHVSPGTGPAQLDRVLRALALLPFVDAADSPNTFGLEGQGFVVTGHPSVLTPGLRAGAVEVVESTHVAPEAP